MRVATAGFALKVAGAPICDVRGYDLGLVVDSVDRYDRQFRSVLQQSLGFDDHVVVTGLVPDGPAAKAGLALGDKLVTVNDRPLPRAAAGGVRSYKTVETAITLLEQAITDGTARFAILRSGRQVDVVAHALPSCGTRVQLLASSTLNAFSDDRYATITTAMADYAANDDELAFIIGHELAHSFLRHEELLDRAGIARPVLGNLTVSPHLVIGTERQADYIALYLMARAGYRITDIPEFWRRFAKRKGPSFSLIKNHPSSGERIAEFACTVREIERAQAAGEALLPKRGETRCVEGWGPAAPRRPQN